MRRGILASTNELESLRDRIASKPFDKIYDVLRKRCSLILESAPITESQWRSLWQQGHWGSALHAARSTQGRILDLTIAHYVDPNPAYRNRAIEELKNLVSWSTWVDPCHNHALVDICTAEAAVAATIGLDWLWDDLAEPDRLRVIQTLRHRVIEPYRKAVEQKAWWYGCYHNWNAVVNAGCGLVGLALGDDEPQAQEVYHLARGGLRHFFDALGREGGWDEGIGYWGFAMRYVLLLAEAASRLMDDQKIFHERGMDATGLFPIYFTPNGHSASFGDYATVPVHGTLYNLVKHYGLREVAWWLDTYTFQHDITTTGWSHAGLALLFRPGEMETPEDVELSPVKVFNEIGWAAMADNWPQPSFYVAAKTGDLSANHSQHDMNSIQLQVDGEMILTDPGSPPYSRKYFTDSRHEFYEVQAYAHNTIVVADRDHNIDAQGQIIEAQCEDNYRWIACDSDHACGENVQFVRHLVMVVDPKTKIGTMLIVLDELTNAAGEEVSLYWHTQGKLELRKGAMSGKIVGQRSRVYFAIGSTVKVTVKTKKHRVHANASDHVLRISTGVISKGLFATVFSKKAIRGGLELKQPSPNQVTVKAGKTTVDFKLARRHFQLEKVVTKP